MRMEKSWNYRWIRFAVTALCSAYMSCSVQGYTTENESASSSERAFGDYTCWIPASTQFDVDGTYEVKGSSGKCVYVDEKCSSMSFAGGTLKLGYSAQHGYVVLTRQLPETLEIKNGNGLHLVNGGLTCIAGSSGSRFAFDGLLTTEASSNERRVVLCLGDASSTLRVNSRIVNGNTRPLYIGGTNKVAKSWKSGNRVELAGDCSGFTAEIILWTKGMDTNADTTSEELTLAVGNTVLQGGVRVSRNGALEPLEGAVATVGTVKFNGNNWLKCSRSPSKTTLGKIVVTDTIMIAGGPVKVKASLAPLNNGRYAILQFPSENAEGTANDVELGDFALVDDWNAHYCSLELEDEGGNKVLYLRYEGMPDPVAYVYQTVASAVLGETEQWSDGTTYAESGKHYALDAEELAAGGTSAILYMPKTVNKKGAAYEFPGDSLTLNSGCELIFQVANIDDIIFKCKKINMANGSVIKGNAQQCYFTIDGGVMNLGGDVSIMAGSGRNVRLRSELLGYGCLKLCGFGSGSYPYATYYIRGDNVGFLGSIDMTMRKDDLTTWDAKFSILSITDIRQLGGNLPTLNRKALLLNDYAKLLVESDVAIQKGSNRGVAVVLGAQIEVKEAKSFALETPISLNGELRKLGTGTLLLKGDAVGFGSDGLSETPTDGKNVLSVRGGMLGIGSSEAINGVAVTFESGTKFELRPNFGDTELMAHGIRNVKTATPFALGEGVTALPFSVGSATGKPQKGVPFRLGLFTVKSDCSSVSLIRSAVAGIAYPVAGFKSKSVEVVDEYAGTVTFAIDYSPVGFCLSIR